MLELIYGQAAAARRRWYERHHEARRRLQRPVISVGNLSVGGSGKTPLVAILARWLLERGERPAILSRGYGRRRRDAGVIVVSDGTRVLDDPDQTGDEPLLLAQTVPGVIVAVCEDRHLAGVLAERRLGATVHVLDDGFQHLMLARDLDILVTGRGEIANERVLPRGRLRESAAAAARAHLVVVIGADTEAARAEAWELGVSQWCAARRVMSVDAVAGQEVFAVAAIGRPEQFFAGLRETGLRVRGTRAFRDHHLYTRADVQAIADAAGSAGAGVVVTTEKDAVRLRALQPLPFALSTVPLTLVLDPPDVLFECAIAAIARARGAP